MRDYVACFFYDVLNESYLNCEYEIFDRRTTRISRGMGLTANKDNNTVTIQKLRKRTYLDCLQLEKKSSKMICMIHSMFDVVTFNVKKQELQLMNY